MTSPKKSLTATGMKNCEEAVVSHSGLGWTFRGPQKTKRWGLLGLQNRLTDPTSKNFGQRQGVDPKGRKVCQLFPEKKEANIRSFAETSSSPSWNWWLEDEISHGEVGRLLTNTSNEVYIIFRCWGSNRRDMQRQFVDLNLQDFGGFLWEFESRMASESDIHLFSRKKKRSKCPKPLMHLCH